MKEKSRGILARASAPFMEMFGLSRPTAVVTVLLLGTVVISAFFWFFHSAPPTQLTITAGAPGTSFETNAMKYKEFLARNGVTLNILPSEGSLQNLEHLENPDVQVDIGFVQGGVTNDGSKIKLISLGSISYQPLFVFYRGDEVSLLSQFKGKRVAVGHVGSGTRSLALKLLEMNDITPGGDTVLTGSEGEEAGKALEQGAVDAIFLMGDSASPQLMKKLLRMPGIRLLNFVQADGYCRRISYLNKLELPRGSLDFGKDSPRRTLLSFRPRWNCSPGRTFIPPSAIC